MYSKEDILFCSKVNPSQIASYCQPVDEPILKEIRKAAQRCGMDQLKDRWYRGRDGSDYHYHQSRYHASNLHLVFLPSTVVALFNSHAPCGGSRKPTSFPAGDPLVLVPPSAPFCCGCGT